MTWLVTSPYGPQRSSSWSCDQCPQHAPAGAHDADAIRAEAAAHVESAGHQVTVCRGTSELLLPLASEVRQ
jgi:hypothetical protein